MKSAAVRLVLLGAMTVTALVAVGGGVAKPRTPQSIPATFDAFPGPAAVTFGEQIAYRATLGNKTGTTLTNIRFSQTFPTANGVESDPPVDHTCPTAPQILTPASGPRVWVCNFGSQPAGAELALTVVWEAPSLTPAVNCHCLSSTGQWLVKEGTNDTTLPNDSFTKEVTATLLASLAGGGEKQKAGGYETASASCANPATATGNLQTNPVIDASGNPVSTTVCLPEDLEIPPSNLVDLGYAMTIAESSVRQVEVCIAALGTNCVFGADDEVFSQYVTHVFKVADAALNKNEKITQMSHDGHALKPCPTDEGFGCVVSIDLDPKTKVWTLVGKAKDNGFWSWP